MDKNKKKKDLRLLAILSVTAIFGALNILLHRQFVFLIPYLLLIAASLPTMYFNYSLCKSELKWRSVWYERYSHDGEPSDFRLILGKIGEWSCYILALLLSFVCTFIN